MAQYREDFNLSTVNPLVNVPSISHSLEASRYLSHRNIAVNVIVDLNNFPCWITWEIILNKIIASRGCSKNVSGSQWDTRVLVSSSGGFSFIGANLHGGTRRWICQNSELDGPIIQNYLFLTNYRFSNQVSSWTPPCPLCYWHPWPCLRPTGD